MRPIAWEAAAPEVLEVWRQFQTQLTDEDKIRLARQSYVFVNDYTFVRTGATFMPGANCLTPRHRCL